MQNEYSKDAAIDESALDVELLRLPELTLKYGRIYAEWQKEVSRLEEEIKTKRSELIMEVNEDPEATVGKAKPNGADIEAYYRVDPEYKELKSELLEAQYETNMAEIAYKEISYVKKGSLSDLVKLHGQSYFAGPSMPKNIKKSRKEFEDLQGTVDANVDINSLKGTRKTKKKRKLKRNNVTD